MIMKDSFVTKVYCIIQEKETVKVHEQFGQILGLFNFFLLYFELSFELIIVELE